MPTKANVFESLRDQCFCCVCCGMTDASSLSPQIPYFSLSREAPNIYGIETAKELTVEEVEDLYMLKEVATARINKLFDDVPFPKHALSEMDAEEL